MKPTGPIKLVSQLIDLPLIDRDERWCGVVDDVEFELGQILEIPFALAEAFLLSLACVCNRLLRSRYFFRH